MPLLTQFAAASSDNVFTSLGIDWQMLILQIVAFLLLVFILGKWVYPILIRSVDERQAKIEDAAKAALEAQNQAAKAEEKMQELLDEARQQAAEIVSTAKLESEAALSANEEKAKKQAERIVADAHDQIAKDVLAAKKELFDETLGLVASATEKVVGKVVDGKQNDKIIADAIKESN